MYRVKSVAIWAARFQNDKFREFSWNDLIYRYFQQNHEIGLIRSSLYFFQYKPYKNIILEIIMVSNLKEIFNLKNNKS